MLTPVPMQRVELALLKDDAPQAALLLAQQGCFNPEPSEAPAAQLPEVPGEAYRLAYSDALTHLDKILAHFELEPPRTAAPAPQPVGLDRLAALNAWLHEVWARCSEEQERTHELQEQQRHVRQLLHALEQFRDLDIDFVQLQKRRRIMNLRIGTVPRANVQRLEDAIALAGHVSIRFFTGPDQVHLILAGPSGHAREVERVLQAASWHTLDIPAEFQGLPADMHADLSRRLGELDTRQMQRHAERRAALDADGLRQRLLDAADALLRAAPYAELAALMRGRGSLASMGGWVPKHEVPRLQARLMRAFGARFVLRARDPRPDERLHVPSLISHPAWLRPFARMVLNYGVPRYGEIDPTVLFALSFVLMFGMMFGDVGQGALIALGGMAWRRRLGPYAPLAVAAGASSACFGILYGSVFGFEGVLSPLWLPPFSDPPRMLRAALAWGVGFIAVAGVLAIRNRLAEGRVRDALLDSRGLAGLLLYLALVSGAYRYATGGRAGAGTWLLVFGALAAILANTWQRHRAIAPAERTLIALMEGFEAVMSYVSNTLSFLRIAAFSLNHVALTLAIFTVGAMMHRAGFWVAVVLGNALILGLEGGIVAIQTLRLEYYEGFSRFFGGDGRPFRPLSLARAAASANGS